MRRAIWLLAVCALAQSEVPYSRIVDAAKEPQNWLTYWGDYSGIRHRTLSQVNTANVKDLQLKWVHQLPQQGRYETVPLVVDGVMYITGQDGWAFALDARAGRELWRYHYKVPEGALLVAGSINRGFAILDDRLYMTTPDGHLLCLEAKTGKLLWEIEVGPSKKGYGTTLAPLAVKDKILVGVAGGEYGIRGYLDAYEAKTGKLAWRFYTIPAEGEPGSETWLADSGKRGGAPTWMTGTFDPQLNLIYWGVGNPGPDLYGGDRLGDNLYSCSMLALDPDTGKLKWHYQFTPHDTHDWDAAETPVLVDSVWQGKPRKLLFQANRNGFFYVLDRTNGEFLMAKPYMRQTWLKEFTATGRPVTLPNTEPTEQGNKLCPGLAGGANWMAPSYNPDLKLFYFAYRDECSIYFSSPPKFVEGKAYWGTTLQSVPDDKDWGKVKALDPLTGEAKWEYTFFRAGWAGTLSTSGGLVFTGDEDGNFVALNSRTGKLLWRVQTGAPLATSPITYMAGGKQYVSIASGAALFTFALQDAPKPAQTAPKSGQK